MLSHWNHLVWIIDIIVLVEVLASVRLCPIVVLHETHHIVFKTINILLSLSLSFARCQMLESLFHTWVRSFQCLDQESLISHRICICWSCTLLKLSLFRIIKVRTIIFIELSQFILCVGQSDWRINLLS